MDNSALLAAIGEALFGPEHWKAGLADALGIGRRPLLRWLSTGEIPEGVWRDLDTLLAERQATMCTLRDRLAQRAGG